MEAKVLRIGIVGAGTIGRALAYGFAAAKKGRGISITLVDIEQEALGSALAWITAEAVGGVHRQKISSDDLSAILDAITLTFDVRELEDCDLVIEAATENLDKKREILAMLEGRVSSECIIGFTSSGYTRAAIAVGAITPERCFSVHPFSPAQRFTRPVELAGDRNSLYGRKLEEILIGLKQVPIWVSDIDCFAGNTVFVAFAHAAMKLVEEGVATVSQVDVALSEYFGGGGPFFVHDLIKGNRLTVSCLKLLAGRDGEWLAPTRLLIDQGDKPWAPERGVEIDMMTGESVTSAVLAVVFRQSFWLVENGHINATHLNWLSKVGFGFKAGVFDLAARHGMATVHSICRKYAETHPGFTIPKMIAEERFPEFYETVAVEHGDDGIATVTVWNPPVNQLSRAVIRDLGFVLDTLSSDAVRGIILTGFNGTIAGADITELARATTPDEATATTEAGHELMRIMELQPKPIIFVANGPVLGGGCELAMACHARMVGSKAMIGQPEVNLGLIPGWGGTQRLPRLIGVARALELLRTGWSMTAAEASESGWAFAYNADPLVTARAILAAHFVAKNPRIKPISYEPIADLPSLGEIQLMSIGHHSKAIDGILVEAVLSGVQKPLAEGLAIETAAFGRCAETEDMRIGLTTFLKQGARAQAPFVHR